MANPKKNPKKTQQAWKGIPSIDKPGWQYLFLGNPRTGQLVKLEIPARYAYDKRGYPFPDYAKNVKVKGVKYNMHKRENHWDASIAKKKLDRLFSAGFIIIPPDQIKIVTSADAKKFKPPPGEFGMAQKKKRGNRGENQGNPQFGEGEGGEEIFTFGEEGDGDGDGNNDSGQELFSRGTPKSSDIASKPAPKPASKPVSKPASDKKSPPKPAEKGDKADKADNKDGEDTDNGKNEIKENNQEQPDLNKSDDSSREYEQHAQNSEKDDTILESKEASVNEDELSFEDDGKKEDTKAVQAAAKAASEQERLAREKAKAVNVNGSGELKPDAEEKQIHQKVAKVPRKHRGNRRRLGKRVVEVDRYAKGKSGNGSRVKGIYSYSEVVFNAQVYHAAKKSAEVLSNFLGKSQAMIEYGIRADIPDLLIRLEDGDNPIPALEIPQNRPKMKIMISPDCSPSTHDWNGLACAWAIMLAKSPDLDVLFCVNSNGEPVKISSERYLTLMRSSDIIIYLGDADGMSHNKEWAREYGQHVIALSSANHSIGTVPPHKHDKVHLIVQKYGRGILRYVTGVSSKDPRTWVKALNLCMLSLEAK